MATRIGTRKDQSGQTVNKKRGRVTSSKKTNSSPKVASIQPGEGRYNAKQKASVTKQRVKNTKRKLKENNKKTDAKIAEKRASRSAAKTAKKVATKAAGRALGAAGLAAEAMSYAKSQKAKGTGSNNYTQAKNAAIAKKKRQNRKVPDAGPKMTKAINAIGKRKKK